MLDFTLDYAALPAALQQLVNTQQKRLDDFLASHPKASYKTLVPFLENLSNRLQLFWSPIAHLNAVMNNEALRESYEQCLPILSAHDTWLGQHETLFHAFETIAASPDHAQLKPAQKKYLTDSLRDFKRAGVHLAAEQKKQFAEITCALSQLMNQYEQNLINASDAWQLTLTEPNALKGLPEHALAMCKENAEQAGVSGFLLNLQAPCFSAVITYAEDRSLRQTIYEAWITRASDIGPSAGQFDNSKIMYEIVKLKYQLAQLLGFPDYASYALETKMAATPKTVDEFLNTLLHLAKPFAEKEYAQLKIFAQTLGIKNLQAWDIAYVSEHLKKQQLDFDDEQIRPYFPLEKVLAGLFDICATLFTIRFKRLTDLPSWHEDVQVYAIQNQDDETIAYFYFDLFARAKKRGGAWMDDAQAYWHNPQDICQKPIAFLTCNFTPPLKNQSALLTHDEVVTLFHEFGHGLHHMLTEVHVLGLTGTHVEWDAVELPSQLLENWCWQNECLKLLSSHIETKEPLPHDLIHKLLDSKNFLSGLFLVRQLEFALFDLQLHWHFDPEKGPEQIQQLLDQVRKEVAVIPVSPLNRFQHSFSHIFAGGYSAGYYSYLWAEVLSADAFDFFEKQGILNPEAGEHFRKTILSQGGSEPFELLFKNFRGRKPALEPLLKSYGLIA